MKKIKKQRFLLLVLVALLGLVPAYAQDDEGEEEEVPKTERMVKLRYFNQSNQLQYLQLESLWKTGKKISPRPGISLLVYLDSVSEANLLAKVNTGNTSRSRVHIPPSFQESWNARPAHEFIVVEPAVKAEDEELDYTLAIQKGKITIDTSASDGETRNITVTVMKLDNEEWIPAPEVEMKVGVERFGGILTAGDEETYTTDSSGTVTVEFTRKDIPGNEKGNVKIAARIEENEDLGNLYISSEVPWGKSFTAKNDFFSQRTLWAKSSRAPYWLMFLAYGIIAGVWSTLIYLVFQLIKVIRLGRTAKAQ